MDWITRSLALTAMLVIVISCTGKQERIQPKRTDITESVYTSITVQPDSLYQAYATINGIVETNFVEEGDTVSKGAALVQVVNTNPQLNTENAKLSLDLARKNFNGNSTVLNSIREEIGAAKLRLSNDSVNYCRQKNLWDQQIGSKVEFDTKKLAYELSQNNLNLLEDKFERTRDELQTQLQQAENNYRTALTTTDDFTIESKINGKVYAVYKNPGEIVNTMEPLASVGSSSVFIIEMLVDEVDIVKIRRGQQVVLTLDAYNDEVFTASVHKIYPKKDQRNQTFVVEAFFEEQPNVLFPGLSGEANIVIAKRTNSITIPRRYLLPGGLVLTPDGEVNVETGLESMDRIEILSGITEETWLVIPEQ